MPEVASSADAIAAWAGWEQGEQWLLRRLGQVAALEAAPARLVEALRRASRAHAQAGMAVDADTGSVVRALAAHNIPCVLLKGPARRAAAGLYPLADARRTSDVDVLVQTSQAEAAWRLLASSGYAPLEPFDPAHAQPGESELWAPSRHHLRPLTRPGGAAVELHVSTAWELPAAEAWSRSTAGAREIEWQGLTVRVPSATELLWHGLTHAQRWASQSRGPSTWILRYWLDAAAIQAAADVDWSHIAERLGGPELPDAARARLWLSAAAQLAGVPLPPSIAATRAFPLPEVLRWRLVVFTRTGADSRWRDKLLDEATRAELRLPLMPLVSERPLPIQLRRRTASLLARAVYVTWRSLSR